MDEKTKKRQARRMRAPKVNLDAFSYHPKRKDYNLTLIDSNTGSKIELKPVNSIVRAREVAYAEINNRAGAMKQRYGVSITNAYTDEQVGFVFMVYAKDKWWIGYRFVKADASTGKLRSLIYEVLPNGRFGEYLVSSKIGEDSKVAGERVRESKKKKSTPAPKKEKLKHLDLPEKDSSPATPKYQLLSADELTFGKFVSPTEARKEICSIWDKNSTVLSVVKTNNNGRFSVIGSVRYKQGKFVWIQMRNGRTEDWLINPKTGELTGKYQ